MIKTKNLVKNYKTGQLVTEVLRGIDLEIKTGEYVAIHGRSGAGKSTLLYQLGLLDYPTLGDIWIDGINVGEMSSGKRLSFRLTKLGYIFQDYALLPELTAKDNVMVPLIMQGFSDAEVEKMAEKALVNVGLEDRMNNLPSQLSGGQQQRVSIARAIANNPKILFADEPTANLDSQTAEKIMKLLKKLNEAGQTIVLVSHEKEYYNQADRVILLSDGKIVKK